MSKVQDEVQQIATTANKKPAKNDREARMKALREKSKAKKERTTLPPIKKQGGGAGFQDEILQ